MSNFAEGIKANSRPKEDNSELQSSMQIIECVPNFSEGRDQSVIDGIAAAISNASSNGEKVKLLHIDPGEAANRTVMTFIGSPEAVCEAAFQGVKAASELIDMRKQHGTHPRSGATDVLPLVPITGITLEECAELSRSLAKRIYDSLGIASYCYEAAAYSEERKKLEWCRKGEYEALPEKLADPGRRPDFGPDAYDETTARSGAINIGARNFLIAVNFNLNSRSADIASLIAREVRESGYRDSNGNRIHGTLKGCKSIGWFIEEYGIAQVSMNITDISVTPLHKAYEEVCRVARDKGVEVTGTEIIGLVPKKVLIDAGKYFLAKANLQTDISDKNVMQSAIQYMRLDDLCPFPLDKKVIEEAMK